MSEPTLGLAGAAEAQQASLLGTVSGCRPEADAKRPRVLIELGPLVPQAQSPPTTSQPTDAKGKSKAKGLCYPEDQWLPGWPRVTDSGGSPPAFAKWLEAGAPVVGKTRVRKGGRSR